MRRLLVIVFVLAQLLVLGFMAGEREYILRFGRTVYLRTAPLDPRDVFRGDFVRLDYEVSAVPLAAMKGTLKDHLNQRDRRVYTVLSEGPDGLAGIDHATDAEPEDGLFIKGRLSRGGWFWGRARARQVRYGIEQLFVQQGKGKEIESRHGGRDGLQIPLEVAVAIGGNGTAVIKDYRWSRLGIRLEVLRLSERAPNADLDAIEGPLSPEVKVSLKNVSDSPLALVVPGADCGFELVPAVWAQQEYGPTYRGCESVEIADRDVVRLEPEAVYSVALDLSEPRWHVRSGEKIGEIGRLAEFDRFRIVYRAPGPAEARALSAAEEIWPGHLPSQAFSAFGRID